MKPFRKVRSETFDKFMKDKKTTEKNVYREYDPDNDHDEVIYHYVDEDNIVIGMCHSVIPCQGSYYIRG